MAKCALCGVMITSENDSQEHVIPRSIGGRKTISGFLCRPCNNRSGQTWDAALAEQLNPLSLLFRIKREGSSIPSQVFNMSDGSQIEYHHDAPMTPADPEYSEIKNETGV